MLTNHNYYLATMWERSFVFDVVAGSIVVWFTGHILSLEETSCHSFKRNAADIHQVFMYLTTVKLAWCYILILAELCGNCSC